MKFNEIIKNEKIVKAITEMGFDEMMPIQEKSIPYILEGNNVIGEAHTGTGKTAAFALPLVEMIDPKENGIQALIMAPTRELAIQIVTELNKISKYLKCKTISIVGGLSINDQIKGLKNNPQIIVATPGRLVDLINRKKVDLSNVKFFVLDEVDEMLKVGFKEEIDQIIDLLPEEKQTLLFSATMSKTVKKIALSITENYEIISVTKGTQSTSKIKQLCVITKESGKFSALTNILDYEDPELSIIFGRTKRRVDELTEALNKCGYKAGAIHGDLSQGQRSKVLRRFKDNYINILVATDVAARGLDVEGITHVFNFDLPQEVEYYIHRIGRTGRANKEGISYSFVRQSELSHIEKIKNETKSKIKVVPEPKIEDVEKNKLKNAFSKIDKLLSKKSKVDDETIKFITDSYSPEQLAEALAIYLTPKKKGGEIKLTGEPPVRNKKDKESKGSYRNKRNNKRNDSRRRTKNYKRNEVQPRNKNPRRKQNRNKK